MKILHINKFFDLHGGAENYMHELMRHQQERGHDVHALSTSSPKNLPSRDASRFVTRYNLAQSNGAIVDAKIAANFIWNREAKRATVVAIRELKPDVIHLHNIYHHLSTSILAPIRAANIRCVQTLHDLKLACPNYRMYTEGAPCARCKGGKYYQTIAHHCLSASLLPNLLAALEMGMTKWRQSYERTVHTFICPSQFMADKMIEWGEPSSKFSVVRIPMTTPAERAQRGGGYVLAVGRLSPEKGYEELIKAIARVPQLHLKIAGTGPEQDRLNALIRTLNIARVELVGFRRGEDLWELYRNAEAFIASPIGYENSPLTVLDALAYGLPVIATRIGGLPEMVNDGVNGYLVERASIDGWVNALKRFASLSDKERSEMARASFEHGQKTYPTWEKHLDELEEVYTK